MAVPQSPPPVVPRSTRPPNPTRRSTSPNRSGPLGPIASQERCHVLNLSTRLRHLRPLDLRYHRILATAKLLMTESSRLADDQIDLPSGCQVNHVKHRLPLMSFQRRVQVGVVLVAWQGVDERPQLSGSRFNDEINVLCGSRGAIMGAGE